ncbi:GDCCVxC domain-containing (seleno)protein [Sphingomonas sp. Leaf33]|uniref:GDCCVxC domain-containing (seleno)protein n=1 Tax=Sphingomonas sp. Leaf33 TaxID=1736215 RepID=UPI000B2B32F8|nr:GDCCVxC domain-containing (seleno)protein [Sphingomonas sp. Leaf33]
MSDAAIATTAIEPRSTITCPECGHVETETMPTNACQFFYDCKGCSAVLRPNAGDCCVYCSFADVPCPPIQEARATGGTASCCTG